MAAKLENEYGVISIDREVIARIAGYAAIECYGIVGMAAKNVKDGLVQLFKNDGGEGEVTWYLYQLQR